MAKKRYTTKPHQTLPASLVRKLCELRDQRVGRNHVFTAALCAVRDADWGVPAIGVAVGMDPHSLSRRINRGRHHPKVQDALVELNFPIPRSLVPADAHPDKQSSGVSGTPVPEHITAHLRELRALARRRRRHMPPDSEIVRAAEHLDFDITVLLGTYELTQIAYAIGVTPAGILNRLARRAARIRVFTLGG